MKRVERTRQAAENGTGYEALCSMLKGEYTEESTGARTIRQSGGKDRHSKVFTSRGPRDRRVRLSVATAIRFYDLQDRLGFDQPSKAVEWLLLHCQTSIQALPQLATLHPSHNMVSGQQPPYSSSQNKLFAFQAKPASHFHGTSPLTSSLCLFTPSSNHATSNHAQISSDEDPPQCSNPSSGASSDNPITPLDGLYPNPLTLSKLSPANDQNVSTLVSQHTSSSSRPTCPYASKRKRMQNPLLDMSHHTHVQADDYASSTTNSIDSFGSHAIPLHQDMSSSSQAEKLIDMFNETLFGNHSSIHSNKHFVSASGTNDNKTTLISDNKTTLISNSLQNQPNFTGQEASKILSSAIDGLDHVNTTQLFCDGQETRQTASHALVQQHLVESLCNMHSLMEAGAYHADNALLQLTDASRGTYDNIDELNNVYRMPSPAESTSISRLGGDYSGAGIIMTNNQAQANLYRQCWPSAPNNLLRQDPFLHANFQ